MKSKIIRNQKIKSCPYCELTSESISNPSGFMRGHVYKCCSDGVKSKDQIKEDYYRHNFNIVRIDEFLSDYHEKLFSMPAMSEKYNNINFDAIKFLIEKYGYEIRGVNDVEQIQLRKEKTKKTCLSVYGSENPLSRGTAPFEKRNKTVRERYNVENVFMLEEIKSKCFNDGVWLEKYGKKRKEYISENSKRVWDNLTDEEKNAWLEKSILSNVSTRKAVGYSTSKLEFRLRRILNDSLVSFDGSFRLNYSENGRKRWFFYDIFLKDMKILIEVNGDYWHANPVFYKADDLIHYQYANVFAKDVWKNDEKKKRLAEKNGFKVIYIWENEMKSLSDKELLVLLFERIGAENELYENCEN